MKRVLALALLAVPAVAPAGVNAERPNVVALEAGGRGLLFSLQYERWLGDRVSIGGGLSGFPCVECSTSWGGHQGYLELLLPAWTSFALPFADVHALVLSAGVTIGIPLVSNWNFDLFPNVGIAYQLHLHGGFVLRPGVLVFLVVTDRTFLQPWAGLQIGWSL